jgi:hypothetical protein
MAKSPWGRWRLLALKTRMEIGQGRVIDYRGCQDRPRSGPCSHECSHHTSSAPVQSSSQGSSAGEKPHRSALSNGYGRIAVIWGSGGRRFKSCQPDGESAGQGSFLRKRVGPLRCGCSRNVAIDACAVCRRTPANDGGRGRHASRYGGCGSRSRQHGTRVGALPEPHEATTQAPATNGSPHPHRWKDGALANIERSPHGGPLRRAISWATRSARCVGGGGEGVDGDRRVR